MFSALFTILLIPAQAAAERIPPPAAEAVAKASQTLRDIYGDRLDAASPADQRKLAGELLELGRKSADDPAGQWVCWDQARKLAIAAGDRAISLEAVQELSDRFAYPLPADSAECLRRAREAWKQAEARSSTESWPWRLAAWAWYAQAQTSETLSGLEKVEIEKRMTQVAAVGGKVKPEGGSPGSASVRPRPAERHPKPSSVWLDDLQEETSYVGFGRVEKHGRRDAISTLPDIPGCPASGRQHSIFLHPPSKGASHIVYRLDGKYDWLRAVAVIPKKPGDPMGNTPVTFRVLADDRLVWQSKPLLAIGSWEECSVELRGVKVLRLEIYCAGSLWSAWAAWYEPQIGTGPPPIPEMGAN